MSNKNKERGGRRGGNKNDKTEKTEGSKQTPPVEPKLKNLKNGTVEEGKKALLKCEVVAGNPPPKIKWYKDGIELADKNKPRNIKIKKKKQGKIWELQFRKAAESDTGSYTCEASNNLGKVRTTGSLTVIKAATSTTPSVKTSSHVSRCSESEKDYCVNGGECYTLEVTPGSTKFLCRCPRGYTGNRCQTTDPVRVINQKQRLGIEYMETEELYQKRVLTITGICIALLVVGIMCVVAYCKTKKQRKKLHDRLRQTLRERNAMASMANGCQAPSQPPDNIQLVNQYMTKSAIPTQHVIKKETETSFSTSQYTSSTQQSTPVTHTSSQCCSWSNGKNESVVSDSQSVLVMSSAENSRHGTPSYRGRLNATGGTRELSAYLKSSRETPESFRDSPYSERYVSAMTTPTHLSPVNLLSPVTPSSPPSESSVQLTSLAMSVPSMATSPSGEEERPLLFITSPQLRDKQHQEQSRNQYQRNSAHYNHGLEDSSPLPSSLCIVEDDEYESTQEYDASNTTTPQSPSDKVPNARAKRTKPSAPQTGQAAEQASSSSSSESSSSESETEDERVGEDTPFLSIQNPLAGSLEGDSSRTNPALRLSPQDDLQARLTSVMANQDPIAV